MQVDPHEISEPFLKAIIAIKEMVKRKEVIAVLVLVISLVPVKAFALPKAMQGISRVVNPSVPDLI